MTRIVVFRRIVSVIVAVCCGLFSTVGVGATSNVARESPPLKYLVLSGGDWLAGHGIDVFYYPGNNEYHVTTDKTLWYECGELAIALYMTLGYGQWKYANGSLIQSAAEMVAIARTHPKGFEDLAFFGNGDRTPPRPGDLVVWPGDYNGGAGHVAVVNRVLGSTVEVVQQNLKWDGAFLYKANLYLQRDERERYTLTSAWDGSAPVGWIRTPRMNKFVNQSEMLALTGAPGVTWNRDGDTVYVYLTSDFTRVLANRQLYSQRSNRKTGTTPIGDLTRALDNAGALRLTDPDYTQLVLGFAMGQIRADSRLNPANGVRSVDVTIKYSGDSIWLRPWGGPANGKWLKFSGMWEMNMMA